LLAKWRLHQGNAAGPIRQKVFHGAVVVFADAVVFIEPPTSERLKSAAKLLGTSLAMGYRLDGLGFAPIWRESHTSNG
jgi:hypothetical protein